MVTRRQVILGSAAAMAGARVTGSESPGALRIGFDHPFAPFGFVEDGKPKGMLIELVGAVLERVGRPYEFVPLSLEQSERALVERRVDALAWKGISIERRKVMDFSSPLAVTGGAAFTRPGLASSTDLNDFAGLTVVTPRSGPLYAQIAREFPEVKLRDGVNYEASFESLLAGQADVAALNLQVGLLLAKRKFPGKFGLPTAPYVPVPLAFAVPKGASQELLRSFDAHLAALKGEGAADRIAETWLRG